MEDHEKTGGIVHGFILFEKHTGNDIVYRMKKAVKEGTVKEKKLPELFINGKDTMTVCDINQLKGHTGRALHGIFVSAGGTETAVASERDELKLVAVGTTIHDPAEGRVTAT